MSGFDLASRPAYVGAHVDRVEDERLLAGRATFVADLHLPGMVEMAVIRSHVAHAHVRGVNVDAARAAEGVVGAFAADDLTDVRPFPDFITYMREVKTFPLARDRVRYVGAPVAVVVATDRYVAEDAAELVDVDYEPLPAVTSAEQALADDAPRLYDWPDNRIIDLPSSSNEVDQAFASAKVVRGRFSTQRHTAIPMEMRGCVAEFRHGELTLWSSTQCPHIVRTTLSYVLPISERDIRVVAPDVGGAFGAKTHIYPEEVLACWLAMRLERPVRWIEDRAEHMVATNHAREHTLELEAAVGEDGLITAVRCHVYHDVGSGEIFVPGTAPTFVAGGHVTGPYRIPLADVSITQFVTNKTPSGAYRGFGAPEGVFAVERLIEKVARETGADSADLRRRMLIRNDELPYEMARGGKLDSGSFLAAFDRVQELGAAAAAAARARYSREASTRVGLGFATYVEGTTPSYFATTGHWTSHDSATIRIEPDGSVVVSVGVTTTGQGTTSMVAALAADALGIRREHVRVEMGDTQSCPYGLGGWGSRSTVAGGGAVLKAAGTLRDKMVRIAAHLLEADPGDLELAEGRVAVKGSPDAAVTIADVATAATVRTLDLPEDIEPGLETTAVFDPPGLQHVADEAGRMNAAAAWANASHAAVIRLDVETGEIELLDYIAVHDCGPMINPPIVTGQVHGGVAQGIGGALYEHLPYDGDGQPLAVSFMDYLLPSATEIPPMVVEHFESPSPNTPLGLKGAGEGGTIGPPAAIANAVADALRELGVEFDSLPLTPTRVRELLRSASAAR